MHVRIAAGAAIVLTADSLAQGTKPAAGVALSSCRGRAETALTASSVVVIPLGVATVQHGPHLKLNNNERLGRHLANRAQAAAPMVVAPTLTYHFYPTFLEHPGSTSVSNNTSRDMTIDIVRSRAIRAATVLCVEHRVTTMFPLSAGGALADFGILLGYTDMRFQSAGRRSHGSRCR